jgi:hypothetical protein
MSDFTLPRITEKKYYHIPPVPLLADGTVDGLITIEKTYSFKAGHCVLFKQGATQFKAKIQRVISETQFIVIDEKAQITTTTKLDMSSFLAGSTVELPESKRPVIPHLEIYRQVYEEEPTVAIRNHSVDWLGRPYDTTNPLPVQLSDGSIDIGAVNAELEVQLSHQDNVPDAGDVADSVQVGDGTEILEINPDGSINVNVIGLSSASTPSIVNIPVPNANTEVSYTLTDDTVRFKFRVRDSGAKAKVSYTSGQSGTNYWTVNRGSVYEEDGLDITGKTLYFQLSKANQVVEIMYWE